MKNEIEKTADFLISQALFLRLPIFTSLPRTDHYLIQFRIQGTLSSYEKDSPNTWGKTHLAFEVYGIYGYKRKEKTSKRLITVTISVANFTALKNLHITNSTFQEKVSSSGSSPKEKHYH